MAKRKPGARRPKGQGAIFYDAGRGCYVGQIDLGPDPVTGRRRRPKVSGNDRQEVQDKLDELRNERAETGTVAPRDLTVGQVVTDLMENLPAKVKSPSTKKVMAEAAARIINGCTPLPNRPTVPPTRPVKGIGTKPLARLTVTEVERFLRYLAEAGYAAGTIGQTRSVLRAAIRRAQRDSRSRRNVADLAELPSGMARRVSRSLTYDQIEALLDLPQVADSPWWLAYVTVALMTGLRPGELLGLRWEDVDFNAGVIRVRFCLKVIKVGGRNVRALCSLKTPASKRTFEMPAEVRRVLMALRKFQREERLRYGPGYGHRLENCGSAGLVFCGSNGGPKDYGTVLDSFQRRCARAGIGGDWQMRETRHTAVSVLSDRGATAEQIADVVGHTDATITRKVYRHQLGDTIHTVAQVMDEVFPPRKASGRQDT